MKKLLIFLILTQGCTSYRIKTVQHEDGVIYFFPQKRRFIESWKDMHVYTGNGALYWAKSVIDKDRKSNNVTIKYIKYGRHRKTKRRD